MYKIALRTTKDIAAFLFVLAVVVLSPVVKAQTLYGTLVGNVSDPTNASIAAAKVVAVNSGTGFTREAVTDERGAFRIDGIPPGTYKVTMWHEGYRPKGLDKDGRPLYDEPRTVTKDITIAPRATATVDFELK